MENIFNDLPDVIPSSEGINLSLMNPVCIESRKSVSYKQFFEAFGYKEKDKIYLRTYYENEAEKKKHGSGYNPLYSKFNKQCTVETFEDYSLKNLVTINMNGYGVWFVVNGGGQKDKEVEACGSPRAQFMEIDDIPFNEQWDIIRRFKLTPSVIIQTKKSLHTYWLLKGDPTFEQWKTIQGKLVNMFGSDGKIINPSRVMRLPSYYHNKDSQDTVLCKLLSFHPERRYTQEELLNCLPVNDYAEIKEPENVEPIIESVSNTEQWLEDWIIRNNVQISEKIDTQTILEVEIKTERYTRSIFWRTVVRGKIIILPRRITGALF